MDLKSSNIKLNGISSYGQNTGSKINFGSSTNFGGNINNPKTYTPHSSPGSKNDLLDPVRVGVGNPTPTNEEVEKKVEKLINSINKELLKEEGNGPRKYIDWYYGEGSGVVDWCAIFVNWIFNHNGDSKLYASHNESNAVAGEDIKIAIKHGYGEWFESEYTDTKTTPKPGDVVTFNWVSSDNELSRGYDDDGNLHQWKYETPQGSDHVGYVYDVDDKYIYTIEGNANSYDASSATVTTKKWLRDDIRINGYFRPNYENAVNG